MEKEILCDRLKKAREALDITKAEAARRLGLTTIGYCRYEYGDRTPSMQTLNIIAQCFDTSVDYLLGKTDDPAPDILVINRLENPDLFRLIELCRKDTSSMDRLLAYYSKISKPGK